MGMRMTNLPTGTVTLVFTDIEGSTRLVDHLGPRYPDVITLATSTCHCGPCWPPALSGRRQLSVSLLTPGIAA
jgi:hypothetical protein